MPWNELGGVGGMGWNEWNGMELSRTGIEVPKNMGKGKDWSAPCHTRRGGRAGYGTQYGESLMTLVWTVLWTPMPD